MSDENTDTEEDAEDNIYTVVLRDTSDNRYKVYCERADTWEQAAAQALAHVGIIYPGRTYVAERA